MLYSIDINTSTGNISAKNKFLVYSRGSQTGVRGPLGVRDDLTGASGFVPINQSING